MIVFFKKSQAASWIPKLQSHRGYCVEGLTENTIDSIQKSFQLGYQIVEFDVHLTKDKYVILHHDADVLGHAIKYSNLQDLQKYKKIDLLETLLKWLNESKEKNYKLNIELKTKEIFNSDLEKAVCQLIEKYQVQNNILISSFNPLALMRIRFLNPNIYRSLLLTFEDSTENKWYLKKMIFNFLAYPHALHLRYQDWSKEKFYKLSQHVPVVLWTCNDMDFVKQVEKEIHGIISDEIRP